MVADRFWRELLAARATHKWGNFSWLSLSTLIDSANDILAKADGGRIIDNRRMRWVAAQKACGIDVDAPVRLPNARRVLLLGDPGEMDGSQYVLVRELAATKADVLVLMSDVVYPAGDINAWRDAVYLPYLGLPKSSWKAAEDALGLAVTLPNWKVFATPGNHDWYDGLTGFMFHACGAEPLPEVRFSGAGLTTMQRLVRSAWQNPTRPDRAMLDPLRASVASRWRTGSPGPMPFQPGPYYAIDIGKVGTTGQEPALRLVTVDTGVDGSIDVEQARWIRRQLASSTCPKIVVTGKPIVVNNRIGGIPINRSEFAGATDDVPADLRDLLVEESATGIVATVAGDIHNAQRFVLAGQVQLETDDSGAIGIDHAVRLVIDEAVREKARAYRLAPVQLIAGGGGAYLSATHTIKMGPDLRLPLTGTDPPRLELVQLAHHQFPSREQSAQRFAARVGVLAGIALMALGGLLVTILGFALDQGADSVRETVKLKGGSGMGVWTAVGGSYSAVALAGLLAAAVMAWRRRATFRAGILTAGTVIALFAAVVLLRDVDLGDTKVIAAGIAIAVLIPMLPVALPVLRAFPALRRLVPLRLLAVAVVGAAGAALTKLTITPQIEHNLASLLLVTLVLLVAITASARYLITNLLRMRDEWASAGTHSIARTGIAIASLWPLLLVVPLLLYLGDDEFKNMQRLAILMLLLEVGALLLALTFAAISLLGKAWRHVPSLLKWMIVGVAAGGAPLGWFGADWILEFSDDLKRVAVAFVTAVGAGLVAVGIVMVTSRTEVPRDRIGNALRDRDGIGGKTEHGRDVFRTMAVAAIPGISELAEATDAPFHKSFVIVEPRCDEERTTAIIFEVFAVDDERHPEATDPIALKRPPNAGDSSRGSYLVDRLTLELQ